MRFSGSIVVVSVVFRKVEKTEFGFYLVSDLFLPIQKYPSVDLRNHFPYIFYDPCNRKWLKYPYQSVFQYMGTGALRMRCRSAMKKQLKVVMSFANVSLLKKKTKIFVWKKKKTKTLILFSSKLTCFLSSKTLFVTITKKTCV